MPRLNISAEGGSASGGKYLDLNIVSDLDISI
jgi:hypothetical protein